MVRGRSTPKCAVALLATLLLAGCGSAQSVTYVDPNGPGSGVRAGDGGEPAVMHGVAAVERGMAVVGIRSSLATARTLAVTDPAAAGETIRRAIEEDLPLVEARAAASDAASSTSLRTGLEQLRDAPPRDLAAYNLEVRRLSDDVLKRVLNASVAMSARQDPSYRALLLHETLLAAAAAYEGSFEGGDDTITLVPEYQSSYGLLIDARTRQLEAVPEDDRPAVRANLDRVARRAMSGPNPSSSPQAPEVVLGDLSAIADEVAVSARIDPTWPGPDAATPDRLRSLKRAVAAAVEAAERGSVDTALEQLRAADRTLLLPAAAGIAAVSPSLLAELERDVMLTLPAAVRARSEVTARAAELDARLDEAIAQVEEELELLRESG